MRGVVVLREHDFHLGVFGAERGDDGGDIFGDVVMAGLEHGDIWGVWFEEARHVFREPSEVLPRMSFVIRVEVVAMGLGLVAVVLVPTADET